VCPDGNYQIGHEVGAGRNGNAPILLYDLLPLDLAFILAFIVVPASAAQSFPPPIIMPFTIFGLLLWFVISLSIVLIILIVFQAILRHRFRNPYTNSELENLLTRVNNRMGYTRSPELWYYESSKPVLVPLVGLLFRSIVISKPAEEDLLASPEMAELVLADHLKSIQGQSMVSTWLPVTFFVTFTFVFVRWTGLTLDQAVVIWWAIYWILVLESGRRLIMGRDDVENPVFEEYHTHPDVARCVVFRGSEPTNTELKDISKKRHDPISKESNRVRGYLSFITSLVISIFMGLVLTTWVSNLDPIPFPVINEVVPFVPMIASLIIYEALFFYATRVTYEHSEFSSDI
jgi:hypothetical protein